MSRNVKTKNYYQIVSDLKSMNIINDEKLRQLLQRTIDQKPLNSDLREAYKVIKDNLGRIFMAYNGGNLQTFHEKDSAHRIIEEFKTNVNTDFGSEKFNQFMKFVFLFTKQALPNNILISVFCCFLSGVWKSTDEKFAGLATFLGALRYTSLQNNKVLSLTYDQIVAYTLFSVVTSFISNDSQYYSVIKCFGLLSEGYIRVSTAIKWLQPYCYDKILKLLENVSDFKYFHPEFVPIYYFLCNIPMNPMVKISETENFQALQSTHIRSDFEVVALETIENQMTSTRELILSLAEKNIVSKKRLKPFFGNISKDIKERLPGFAPMAIKLLTECFYKFYRNFDVLISTKLNSFSPNDVEFRITYKKFIKIKLSPLNYIQVPGVYELPLGTISHVEDVKNLLANFIDEYFKDTKILQQLKDNYEKTLEVFSGDKYVASESLVAFVIYFAELVRVTDGVDFSTFIKCLMDKDEMDSKYGNVITQHAELSLIRCIRAVDKFKPFASNSLTNQHDNCFVSSTYYITDNGTSMFKICTTLNIFRKT